MSSREDLPCTNCPKCRSPFSSVTDVRAVVIAGKYNTRRRRRICLSCHAKYSTFEVVVGSPLDMAFQEMALDQVIERVQTALKELAEMRHRKHSLSQDISLADKDGPPRASSPDEIKTN